MPCLTVDTPHGSYTGCEITAPPSPGETERGSHAFSNQTSGIGLNLSDTLVCLLALILLVAFCLRWGSK